MALSEGNTYLIFGTGLLDTVIPLIIPELLATWAYSSPLISVHTLMHADCADLVPSLELRRLPSWITSIEGVSRGEERFLSSVPLGI